MGLDHSLTYRKKSFRNTLHRSRLRKILKILDNQSLKSKYSYLDIGCSNGYLTNLIKERYNFAVSKGMDYSNSNIEIAKNKYKSINFGYINLNNFSVESREKYDLITCFETLEHVGNIENAIKQILSFRNNENTFVLITVPIEIGTWGISKFLIKTCFYRYSLKELKNGTSFRSYFWHLITFQNISKFRDTKDGWGTHFGFDYREVDKLLQRECNFEAKNYLSTRFYLIGNYNN